MTEPDAPVAPVRYDVARRRRDDHAQPSRGDERPRRGHQGGAARRRPAGPRTTTPCAASCSPAAAAPSASARTSRSTSPILKSGGASRCSDTVEEHYNPIVTALATMPKPVVAAVNGVAAGAGASLAFACDFRVVADSAGFNLAFAGVALSCDTGSSWTLPRLVGRAKAMELLYFPRTIGAAEALELGLATKVVARRRVRGRGRDAGRAGWRRARRCRTARSGGRWRTPPRTASPSRWRSRPTMMTLTGGTEDHLERGRRVRGQGEAGLPRPLSSAAETVSEPRRRPLASSCRGPGDLVGLRAAERRGRTRR